MYITYKIRFKKKKLKSHFGESNQEINPARSKPFLSKNFGCVNIIEAFDPSTRFWGQMIQILYFQIHKRPTKGFLLQKTLRNLIILHPILWGLTPGLGPRGTVPQTQLLYDAHSDSALVASFCKSPMYFKINPPLIFFTSKGGEGGNVILYGSIWKGFYVPL